MNHRKRIPFAIVLLLAATARAEDCPLADDLIVRANELRNQGAPEDEQIAALRYAIEVCPANPYAHNNLANYLGDKAASYAEALEHYRRALQLKPDLYEAWVGLGDSYKVQGHLINALEAYLNACQHDEDAHKRAATLLKDQQFNDVKSDTVVRSDAIGLLFDPNKRQRLEQMMVACKLRAVMEPKLVLRNLEFASGKDTISNLAGKQQLQEIGSTLSQFAVDSQIRVEGHSDNRPFSGLTPRESQQRNLELSQARAATVRAELIANGVPEQRIIATGFGSEIPVSKTDQDRNRRVEIKLQ